MNQEAKDFIKINRQILKKIIQDKKQNCLEAIISLPNQEQIARTEAIVEARMWGKFLTEIDMVCGEKQKIKRNRQI